jgi:hypothetical protein
MENTTLPPELGNAAMTASPSQHQDDVENVLRLFKEWMVTEGHVSLRPDHKRSGNDNQRGNMSHFSSSDASIFPSVALDQRTFDRKKRPSVGRRIFRAFVFGFIVTAMIGVAWLAYRDDETKSTIIAAAHSSLGLFLSAVTAKSTLAPDPSPQSDKSKGEAASQSPATPVAAEASPELQQLQMIASDLAIVRRTVEQLARKQELMAQDITMLQASEQSIIQKVVSLTQAAAAARAQAPKKVPKPVLPETTGQPASAPLSSAPPLDTTPAH